MSDIFPIIFAMTCMSGVSFVLVWFALKIINSVILSHFKIDLTPKMPLISGIVMVGVALMMLFIFISAAMRDSQLSQPFEGHFSEYLASNFGRSTAGAYIRGRVVPVNPKIQNLNVDIYRGLPDDLLAHTPDEVGTIVQVECHEEDAGHYTSQGSRSGTAYKWVCPMTIIDKDTRMIVGEKTILGQDPPYSITGSGDWHEIGAPLGENKAIVEYLTGLPRK